MIEGFDPYPKYKESGHAWLGLLPFHWEQLRAKYLFREIDERSKDGSQELLSVSHLTGVTPRNQKTVTMFLAESNIGHKLCQPGDLVINTMWAWMGALGISQNVGIVSPSYAVYRPLADCKILSRFAEYLLRIPAYSGEYQRRSTGVNSSRLRLYPEHFLTIPLVVPPAAEQDAIVRFLDWSNWRLERAIQAKQKLIKLLEEQKQAIIHRAVTRGLDPNVRLKPSGVEWLGDVPEHWEVRRLRSLAHIKTGDRDTINRVDDGQYPFFVRSQNVEHINTWAFDGEAVLTAGDGAGVAKVFHYVNGKFDYHQRVYKFSEFRDILGRFFFEYFRATLKFEALAGNAKSTVDSLRRPMLQNFPVVLPSKEEQAVIVDYLKGPVASIDTTIDRSLNKIDLLREYRTRLIADVVTGKIDVREAAARLPEEVEEPDQVEEPEELVGDDEEGEGTDLESATEEA
jgi:type I restriction enzyme, S subunit